MISRLLNYILIVVVVLLLAAMIWDYYQPPSVVEVFQPAPPPKEVIKYKTLMLECSADPEIKVVYLDKNSASKDDNVPPAAVDDNKKITAIAEVPPHKGKTTIFSIYDLGTGKTAITFRQERPSFLGFENLKELGLRYGSGTSGALGAIYGRYTFFRVGGGKLAAYGELNTDFAGDVEALAMLDLRLEW